ncbi:MAG TPA: hypothetical protein VE263_16355 [Candidatus Angelobacter sp.]|nr:hypothetical protein [Candidatus Angelobacter sp.]
MAPRTVRVEQALFYLEALDKVSAFLFRGFEILFLRMSEDEVEFEELGLDVREFMFAAIAEMLFANRGVDLPRTKLEDKASASVSAGAGMPPAEELLDESRIPFAALGMGEIEELPNREIARMRGHKVEKTGFYFGVTKRAEVGDFVFWNAHKLKG